MKKLFILFFALTGFYCQAQDTLQLNVDIPEPRVGDQVLLSFDSDFFIDELTRQIQGDIEVTSFATVFGSGSNDFSRVIKFNESGEYTLGPFHFDLNGKKIVTDSIQIKVIDKLPFEEGIWVRQVEWAGKRYLLVEQLIENVTDYQQTDNGYSFTVGGTKSKGADFAELIETPEEGIKISSRRSRSTTVKPEGAAFMDPGFSYSFKMYSISFEEGREQPFTLKKIHFKNFPKRKKLSKIEVAL